eukprot:RCo011867
MDLDDLLRNPEPLSQAMPSGQYYSLRVVGDDGGPDMGVSCQKLLEAIELRWKYRSPKTPCPTHSPVVPPPTGESSAAAARPEAGAECKAATEEDRDGGPSPDSTEGLSSPTRPLPPFEMVEGVVLYPGQKVKPQPYSVYFVDFNQLQAIVEDGPCRSSCRSRLTILEHKYTMYMNLNYELEERCSNLSSGGGIYTTHKVDNSVRLSTAMFARDLLSFIIDKAVNHGEDIVGATPEGEPLSLAHFLEQRGIPDPARQLTVESIGLQPDTNERFDRFDIFSKKTTRGGPTSVDLLTLFLKRDGVFIKGRYYGELCRQLLVRDQRKRPFEATEYKVPIFGMNPKEFTELAMWVKTHGLSSPSNRWAIQIPRIEAIRQIYKCKDLQEQLNNIFLPLWEASLQPWEHPELSEFLNNTVVFNVISDESTHGKVLPENRPPKKWAWAVNPPDIYFNYYIYANVFSLNQYRREHGMNTFMVRPNCGETGDLTHLISAYLLADSINHGIQMTRNPVLHYLYYIHQIGVVCSPLADNGLFLGYANNPFPTFFKQGMRVSLATDDPLHFHHTNEPLIEEYATACKVYKLNSVDLCEVARNS